MDETAQSQCFIYNLSYNGEKKVLVSLKLMKYVNFYHIKQFPNRAVAHSFFQ